MTGSKHEGPFNIGSDEMVSINHLVDMLLKNFPINHLQ